MIEEVVPPIAPRSIAFGSVVETSTDDLGSGTELLSPPRTSPLGADTGRGAISVRLPDSVMEELRWVADQEGCEVADIVVNAVDEFLADHWVRNSDF